MSFGNAVLEAIETKKFGGELTEELIRAVVEGYTAGEVPDYQMASLLMAIFVRGMGYGETLALTRAMADSGGRYSFPECVDKHSTGGVGDKISLTTLPIVAACGAPVAKLSGRGLGTTGGTIDKLESIPGLSCDLSEARFGRQVQEIGLAIVEAGDLAPADKAIYALRDTTGTVDSLPLIGSSIVSKKAATGDMDNPLGSAVGNALEVRESVRLLKGEPVPEDLSHEARHVATRLLKLKGIPDPKNAVASAISSGAAFEKFRQFVLAQGGDAGALEDLPVSSEIREVNAPQGGYVARFGAQGVGRAALALGAGRRRKGDRIDPGSGVEVLAKPGDRIERGERIARLYGERGEGRAETLVLEALEICDEPVEPPPAILDSL